MFKERNAEGVISGFPHLGPRLNTISKSTGSLGTRRASLPRVPVGGEGDPLTEWMGTPNILLMVSLIGSPSLPPTPLYETVWPKAVLLWVRNPNQNPPTPLPKRSGAKQNTQKRSFTKRKKTSA